MRQLDHRKTQVGARIVAVRRIAIVGAETEFAATLGRSRRHLAGPEPACKWYAHARCDGKAHKIPPSEFACLRIPDNQLFDFFFIIHLNTLLGFNCL